MRSQILVQSPTLPYLAIGRGRGRPESIEFLRKHHAARAHAHATSGCAAAGRATPYLQAWGVCGPGARVRCRHGTLRILRAVAPRPVASASGADKPRALSEGLAARAARCALSGPPSGAAW